MGDPAHAHGHGLDRVNRREDEADDREGVPRVVAEGGYQRGGKAGRAEDAGGTTPDARYPRDLSFTETQYLVMSEL